MPRFVYPFTNWWTFGLSLINYMIYKIFLLFHRLSFHFLDGILYSTKVPKFGDIQFFFSFPVCDFGVIFEEGFA